MSWEQNVLGTALHDPETMVEADQLLPSDFSIQAHSVLWAEMLALQQRNGLSVTTLANTINEGRDWQRVSSGVGSVTIEEYLALLMTYRGTPMSEFVRHVMHDGIRKAVKKNAALIAAEADDERIDPDELLNYAEQKILSLRRSGNHTQQTLGDILTTFLPRLDAQRDGTFRPAMTPDVVAIRDIISFLEPTEYMIVAGRPGDGKSSILRYEARRHLGHGGKVHIFNLENDPNDYARSFLALETNIDSDRIKDPRKLSPEELQQIREAAAALMRMPLIIDTVPSASAAQITQKARRSVAQNSTDLIIVDYVQLMSNGLKDIREDVTVSSKQLRSLALELNVPIMAAAQLNRSIETRNNTNGEAAEPMLADLRETGSLEQDCTIAMFLRHIWKTPDTTQVRQFPENIMPNGTAYPRPKAVPIRAYILKNRNGSTGISDPIKWVKSTGRYQTLVRDANIR